MNREIESLVNILIISFMYIKLLQLSQFRKNGEYASKQTRTPKRNRSSRGAALRSMNLAGPNNLWGKMSCNYRKLRLIFERIFNVSFPLQRDKGLRHFHCEKLVSSWMKFDFFRRTCECVCVFVVFFSFVWLQFLTVVHTTFFRFVTYIIIAQEASTYRVGCVSSNTNDIYVNRWGPRFTFSIQRNVQY